MNEKKAAKIPAKWLVVIIFALVAYGLGQPLANRQLGLKLPSLASLMGYQDSATVDKIRPRTQDKSSNRPAVDAEMKRSADDVLLAEPRSTSTATGIATADEPSENFVPQISRKTTDSPKKQASEPTKPPLGKDSDLLYGILKETGKEDYISPAGLRFTRGSEEGHRLKHLARHLEDQPDRLAKHGVFNGDMAQVLTLLDEAFSRASSGAPGTSKRNEAGVTVYEVNFSKPIGYLGGRQGAQRENPDCKRLRMVVDDNRLITAFPF